jgi:hypothetical protein
MSDAESDLRATAADMAVDAERLKAIEEEKLGLDAKDPRMLELSVEAEQIVRRMVPKAVAEVELATDMTAG